MRQILGLGGMRSVEDTVWNEEMRRRAGVVSELTSRLEQIESVELVWTHGVNG